MKTNRNSFHRHAALVAACFFIPLVGESIAAPTIARVAPAVLVAGASTTITINGADLAANPRVLLPFDVASQSVKPGATANQVQIDVALDRAATHGIHSLRVATETGVSSALAVVVTSAPLAAGSTSGPPSKLAKLPAVIDGEINGGEVARAAFTGSRGDAIVIDVAARRLGGNLNPAIRLLDARGVQVAFASEDTAPGGDARLAAQLPADGTYTVELSDALFRAASPGRFVLQIGALTFADVAYPVGIQSGMASSIGYARSNAAAPGFVISKNFAVGEQFSPWPASNGPFVGTPRLFVSDFPEAVEFRTGSAPQTLPAAPVAVSGRFVGPKEDDQYLIPVKPGATYRVELFADRIESRVDGAVAVRTVQGQQLAAGDDREETTDPLLEVKAPANAQAIIVSVRDLNGRHGDDFYYRLVVMPVDRPDFSLSIPQDIFNVPQRGRRTVRIDASRQNYNGPIPLELAPLAGDAPALRLLNNSIPAGATTALLSIEAPTSSRTTTIVRLLGRGEETMTNAPRVAFAPDSLSARGRSWSRGELALATVTAESIAVDWNEGPPDAAPAGQTLSLGVKLTRAAGATTPTRLSIITSQAPPKKTVNKQQVDDVDKTIRLEAPATIAANQTTGAVKVLLPATLPPLAYDFVIRAELLSADGQNVVSTADTAARRVIVVPAGKPLPTKSKAEKTKPASGAKKSEPPREF